jgi:hypothetical protein
MATVNLGRIKPVYRGVYNNSTAYVVDDMVQYTDSGILSTYICTTASQGNAPSSSGTAHGSWAYLAKGGVAGNDFGLANKEIAFKTNAGALDGIPIGTAGQALKVNSGATGYEFGQAGGVAQVVMGEKLDTTVANSSFYTAIPNLSATITPSSTSSKILVDMRLSLTGQHGDGCGAQIQRSIGGGGYSAIGIANANGSRRRSSFSGSAYTGDGSGTDTVQIPVNTIFLDSPNTTSAITYKPYIGSNGGNYFGVNISCSSSGTQQGDSSDAIVMTSRIILMEITV